MKALNHASRLTGLKYGFWNNKNGLFWDEIPFKSKGACHYNPPYYLPVLQLQFASKILENIKDLVIFMVFSDRRFASFVCSYGSQDVLFSNIFYYRSIWIEFHISGKQIKLLESELTHRWVILAFIYSTQTFFNTEIKSCRKLGFFQAHIFNRMFVVEIENIHLPFG